MFKINEKNLVHVVLGHSYLLFFFSLLVGSIVDIFVVYRIESHALEIIGIVLLFISPLLILWAQKTTHTTRRFRYFGESLMENFARGPYAFTRSPTHYGIGLMILGYGLALGSVPIIVTTIVTFVITKSFFLKKEEKLLVKKYGAFYQEYKKKVRF